MKFTKWTTKLISGEWILILFTFYFQIPILHSQVDQKDSLALVSIYNALNGPTWDSTWILTNPVKTWYRVSLTNNRVSNLALWGNNLSGSIPEDIGQLTELVALALFSNQITGPIPLGLGKCTKLQEIQLSGNMLSDTIPDTLRNLTNIYFFDVANNNLTGSIPEWIGEWQQLVYLEIHGNSFTGGFPHATSTLVELKGFSIFSNQFIGPMPNLEDLTKLQTLLIWNNQLEGSPDDFLGYYPNLTYVALGKNFMFGSLSAGHFNPDTLEYLEISETLLEDIGDFSEFELKQFDIQDNFLTFEDIIPNIGQTKIRYIPQKQVGLPVDTILVTGDTLQLNTTIDTTLSTNQYQWFRDDIEVGSLSNSGELFIFPLEVTHAGGYVCKITNPAVPDLVIESYPYLLNITTSLKSRIPELIQIYPNPVSDQLFVHAEDQKIHQIVIRNLLGQVVASHTFRNDLSLNISHIGPGMYHLVIDHAFTKKILKQ